MRETATTDIILEARRLTKDFQGFAAVKAFPQFEQTPIYITEADPDGCAACPASDRPANAYRNSTAYGAYELAMMKHTIELAEQLRVNLSGVLTWAFAFPGTPYFAGYRALASNGIQLPVLSAFQLLGRLVGTRLPLSSSGALPLSEILEFALELSAEAGRFILPLWKNVAVDHKSDGSEVTEADRGAEQVLRRRIAERYPDHAILGEEFAGEIKSVLDGRSQDFC